MTLSTTNYEMFIFRKDNRSQINRTHVERLKESIQSKNMLELRPIIVNGKMEVIDGQHRLLAAKDLNLPIFYKVEKDMDVKEILLMNIAQAWGISDYLNFYVQNGYEEYIKLNNFIIKNKLNIKVAVQITMKAGREQFHDFKNGKYVFESDTLSTELEYCWDIINYIEKCNGTSLFTKTTRFWKALFKLVKHCNYDHTRFMKNLNKMTERISPQVDTKNYCKMLMDIHNWKMHNKIDIYEDDL